MVKNPNLTAAKRIRAFRIDKNWSQEELAAESGLHRTYIGAVERNERNITLLTLARIAHALNRDIKDFF